MTNRDPCWHCTYYHSWQSAASNPQGSCFPDAWWGTLWWAVQPRIKCQVRFTRKGIHKKNGYFMVRLAIRVELPLPNHHPLSPYGQCFVISKWIFLAVLESKKIANCDRLLRTYDGGHFGFSSRQFFGGNFLNFVFFGCLDISNLSGTLAMVEHVETPNVSSSRAGGKDATIITLKSDPFPNIFPAWIIFSSFKVSWWH